MPDLDLIIQGNRGCWTYLCTAQSCPSPCRGSALSEPTKTPLSSRRSAHGGIGAMGSGRRCAYP